MTSKAQVTKEKIDKLDYIKIKICASKDIINRVKGNPENRRKYLQIIYLIRGQYPEYIENS